MDADSRSLVEDYDGCQRRANLSSINHGSSQQLTTGTATAVDGSNFSELRQTAVESGAWQRAAADIKKETRHIDHAYLLNFEVLYLNNAKSRRDNSVRPQ